VISSVSLQLVLGRVLAIDDGLAAFESKITVQLEHGGAGRHQVGAVNLNLVTALGAQQPHGRGGEDRQQNYCFG